MSGTRIRAPKRPREEDEVIHPRPTKKERIWSNINYVCTQSGIDYYTTTDLPLSIAEDVYGSNLTFSQDNFHMIITATDTLVIIITTETLLNFDDVIDCLISHVGLEINRILRRVDNDWSEHNLLGLIKGFFTGMKEDQDQAYAVFVDNFNSVASEWIEEEEEGSSQNRLRSDHIFQTTQSMVTLLKEPELIKRWNIACDAWAKKINKQLIRGSQLTVEAFKRTINDGTCDGVTKKMIRRLNRKFTKMESCPHDSELVGLYGAITGMY